MGLCVLAQGCGHTALPPPAAPAAQVVLAAPTATTLQTPTPPQPPAAVEPSATRTRTSNPSEQPASSTGAEVEADLDVVDDIMGDHFLITAWARDAIIYGELDALREPLMTLADFKYPAAMPPGLTELQDAARVTAKASTLVAAAAGVATMGRVCGECHQKRNLGIEVKRQTFGGPSKGKHAETIDTRMFRHGWAAERLWEGLVAPSDHAWQAGAAALAHAPKQTPKLNRPASEALTRQLRAMRELGVRASTAASMQERAEVYALTLASCAQCHADNAIFEPRADEH
jgi:mono/diheme cytochrome c family protein